MQNTITNNYYISFFLLFVLFAMSLSIVSINAGINIRIGQLSILLMFAIVLLYDLKNKDINETLLIFFIFFAVLLTFVSKNSSYSKIDEIKFVIKYAHSVSTKMVDFQLDGLSVSSKILDYHKYFDDIFVFDEKDRLFYPLHKISFVLMELFHK